MKNGKVKKAKKYVYVLLYFEYGALLSQTASSLEEAREIRSNLREDGYKRIKIVKFEMAR